MPLHASARASQAAPFSAQATSQQSASPFAPHVQCGSTVVGAVAKVACENACANVALCDPCLPGAIHFRRGRLKLSGDVHLQLNSGLEAGLFEQRVLRTRLNCSK